MKKRKCAVENTFLTMFFILFFIPGAYAQVYKSTEQSAGQNMTQGSEMPPPPDAGRDLRDPRGPLHGPPWHLPAQ